MAVLWSPSGAHGGAQPLLGLRQPHTPDLAYEQEVGELLREAVLSPYEVAEALGKLTKATADLLGEMANDWELVKVGKRRYTAQTELLNVSGPRVSRGLPVLARTEKTFKASTKDEVLQDLQRMQRECGSRRNGGSKRSRAELKT